MNSPNFTNLQEFIGNYIEFTETDFRSVIPYLQIIRLKKGEVFIAEGEVANRIAFTNKGYLRVFIKHDGDEITRDITPIHSFATALPSFITQKPSCEVISAITDCELFCLSKQNLEHLYDNYPNWERLGRRIIEEMFVDAQLRLNQFITQTAEVRYRLFLKRYPDMMHEVPLKYIADYLGIKLQSLSRLRKTMEWH